MLTIDEGEILIKTARRAITEYLSSGAMIPPPDVSEKLEAKRGVFVTLNRMREGRRELRGCIGYPLPMFPLIEAAIRSAVAAAAEDPRFAPVNIDEMKGVLIEVSVLTVPELVNVADRSMLPNQIRVGRDGLIAERGPRKGLLLPQVPVEWNWDVEEFLSQTCFKAGLPSTSWLDNDVKIYKFQAQIFEEEAAGAGVREKPSGGSL